MVGAVKVYLYNAKADADARSHDATKSVKTYIRRQHVSAGNMYQQVKTAPLIETIDGDRLEPLATFSDGSDSVHWVNKCGVMTLYQERVQGCSSCPGTGKTVVVPTCNIPREVFDLKAT